MKTTTETRGGHGGRRVGAGRPQQRIRLNLETANLLREIVRLRIEQARRALPEFAYTPDEAVEDLIVTEAMRLGALKPESREHWLAVARGETKDARE